jgi:hypothetical protein
MRVNEVIFFDKNVIRFGEKYLPFFTPVKRTHIPYDFVRYYPIAYYNVFSFLNRKYPIYIVRILK